MFQFVPSRAVAMVVAAVAIGCAAQASAEELVITYSGTVNGVYDPNGLFGALKNDGTDQFVDTYKFDLTKGASPSGAGWAEIYGGSNFGISSPLIDSTLTINGHTLDFPGGAGDQEFYQQGSYAEAFSNNFGLNPLWKWSHILIDVSNAPDSFLTPFSGAGAGYGSFFICDPTLPCNATAGVVAGNYDPTYVTAAISSGAPEPAEWTLLIVGVGIAGAALRGGRPRIGLASWR